MKRLIVAEREINGTEPLSVDPIQWMVDTIKGLEITSNTELEDRERLPSSVQRENARCLTIAYLEENPKTRETYWRSLRSSSPEFYGNDTLPDVLDTLQRDDHLRQTAIARLRRLKFKQQKL